MNVPSTPTELINWLRTWFHPKDRSVLLATDTFLNLNKGKRLVISGGSVTKTQSNHTVDTEGLAATDDLDTIAGGFADGDILIAGQYNDGRDVKYTENGNLRLPSGIDIFTDEATHRLGFIFDGTNWLNFANPFGRWSLIAETVLTQSAASITFATIPQTYRHLILLSSARTDRVLTVDNISVRFNADAGNNYDKQEVYGNNAAVGGGTASLGVTAIPAAVCDAANSRANSFGGGHIFILNYTNTNFEKDIYGISGNEGTPTSATMFAMLRYGHWRSQAAITSITILPGTGPNFVANSIFQLYGVL